MEFSALVDADYLETEKHFNPEKSNSRIEWPAIEKLWEKFKIEQDTFVSNEKKNISDVNTVRNEVYGACLNAANEKPGIFKLTVPTGGGKTRSGLAFCLAHACKLGNKKRRIIIALPYTSIIDQTAKTYREILGNESVLEHHSQIQQTDDEEQDEEKIRQRLACENWDAPLIVTTTVQLFESLFHNKPGHMRKIHNLANSIILLDEVQTLPPEILKPTLDILAGW